MEFVEIGMLVWMWVTLFAGLFAFGGSCAVLLMLAIRLPRQTEERHELAERDTMPCLWPEPEE